MPSDKTKYITPLGEAFYPRIRTTETYGDRDSGKYSCAVKVPKEKAVDLATKLMKEWNIYMSDNPKNTYKKDSKPLLGYKVDGDYVIFKAKMKAHIITKAGDSFDLSVPIFDAKGRPLSKETDVGHGSTVRMCFTTRPFYMDEEVYGLQLLLKAVQVQELKEPYTPKALGAEYYGFESLGSDVTNVFPPF